MTPQHRSDPMPPVTSMVATISLIAREYTHVDGSNVFPLRA